MKKIAVVLVDDWELRGNGSGSVLELQHKPALKLLSIYEKQGVKGTFTAEVLQQLAFEKVAGQFEEIYRQKELWKATVKIFKLRGHDVQLHLHIQWQDAVYHEGAWQVGKSWNIADYPPEIIEQSFRQGKAYLLDLLSPIDPDYQVCAFRSGFWAMQPSPVVLKMLEKYGIDIDISVCWGVYQNDQRGLVDYRRPEEPYFPYFPSYREITRVADQPTGVIEVPTQSLVPKVAFYNRWRGIKSERTPFNLAGLNLAQMKHGFDRLMERFIPAPQDFIPLVLENHTKDMIDFNAVDRFISYIKTRYGDWVGFMTLREIRDKLLCDKEKLVRLK